jgi:hypothetical protein
MESTMRSVYLLLSGLPGAITKIDSAGGQGIELSSFGSHTEIRECIRAEVVSKDIEVCGPRVLGESIS